MHILDSKKFRKVLKEKGYQSIGKFAKDLGIHRNSIHYYLSGHGVFPENFEKIIKALGLRQHEILIDVEEKDASGLEQIALLIDRLHLEFPNVTFVLFGSRTRGVAHKYADWDIGVFSEEGLQHILYRKIVRHKNDFTENLPFFIDLINLNVADSYFIREISKQWVFLTGRLCDWIKLQSKVAR